MGGGVRRSDGSGGGRRGGRWGRARDGGGEGGEDEEILLEHALALSRQANKLPNTRNPKPKMLIPKPEIQHSKPEPLIGEPYTQHKVDEFNEALAEIYYPTVPVDAARHFLEIYPTSVEDAVDENVNSMEVEEAAEGCDRSGQEVGGVGVVAHWGAVVGAGGGAPAADVLGTNRRPMGDTDASMMEAD